jgi:4-amino-4-deoxy-L-arabinose transferase-like glycosyltransferase
MATLGSYKHFFGEYRFLWPILALSLVLNLWGIHWGAPNSWHPDEITERALSMVAERSINPHYFTYGGLHYYVVGAFAVLPVYLQGLIFDPPPPREDRLARNRWWQTRLAWMIVLARIISAVMSTAVVLFTFVIGKMVFNESSAYLAALFLSVSMPFVAVAHFATMDSPTNFWYWLSCLFALFIWKRGGRIWYALAALTAGAAIGIKVDRVVILLPLLLAHFLRGEGFHFRRLITFAILVPGGYLLANPVLFTSTFEFLDGFTRDMFYQALKGLGAEQSSYLQVLQEMKSGLGLPLFLAALSGLAYGIYSLALNRSTAAILWLLSTFLPYYLIFGSTSIQSWYLPILFPALMILAAHACVDLMSVLPQRLGFAAKCAVAGLIVYSVVYTGTLVLQFSNDSRYLVAEWIERKVPINSIIEIGERGPIIAEDKYNVINSLRDQESMDYAREQHENLERYRPYQEIRQLILNAEKWAGQRFGLPVRKQAYVNWIDNVSRNVNSGKNPQRIFPQAEYVVLVEDLYPQKLRTLAIPASGYRLAAKFHFVDAIGLRPEFPFVNPAVYVFQRVAAN